MRKILMLAIALTVAAASRLPAAPVECNCTYCQAHPDATCVIHTYFQTVCRSYSGNFCVE
jgi:hypothetical protein